MKLSLFGRLTMALLASMALALGMTACGGGTIGYMWVLGTQYNQISGFKIDDYTGNLTEIPKSPFAAAGVNPVSIVVKAGGRYVYVIDQGTAPATGLGTAPNVSSGIIELAVGGDGTLTYQNTYHSQGFDPIWAQFDSTGTYLYVLDEYAPGPITNGIPAPNTSGLGSITVFQTNSTTGELTLVTNSQTQINGVNTTYFGVGASPLMMKQSGNCLFTVDSADQSVFPYQVNGSGQLVITQTGTIHPSATKITSINGNSQYVYLTDAGTNNIIPLSITGGCNLSVVTGGQVPNITGTSNPTYSIIDNSGKYLSVLNQSTTNVTQPTPFSSISAFTVNTATGQLQAISGAPYTVGSNPVCMVEDTSNQYVYVSNKNDNTVTGKVIDQTTGTLTDLSRGASFPTTGTPTCLALSGAVD
jgi:6-phosphogluconolactonase (cycloisomerase 2 family)